MTTLRPLGGRLARSALVVASTALVLGVLVAAGVGAVGSGSLGLRQTVAPGTVCLSSSAPAAASADCEPLFDISMRAPGDQASADVTMANVGTLDAASFTVSIPGCTPADAPQTASHGAGDPCAVLLLNIQEFSDPAFTVSSACRFGDTVGSLCDFSDASSTVASFAAAYPDAATGLELGSIPAGGSRYNDKLRARDTVKGNDAVLGGAGNDRCTADPRDKVVSCP